MKNKDAYQQLERVEKELVGYKDAVWKYILDHSDMQDNGHFFVKFHTSSRKDFEKHVFARQTDFRGYTRVDPFERQAEHEARVAFLKEEKLMKKRQYKLSKERRMRWSRVRLFFVNIFLWLLKSMKSLYV